MHRSIYGGRCGGMTAALALQAERERDTEIAPVGFRFSPVFWTFFIFCFILKLKGKGWMERESIIMVMLQLI